MIQDVILGAHHQCIVFTVEEHFISSLLAMKDRGWVGGLAPLRRPRHFEIRALPSSMLIGYKTKYFFATF